MAIRRIVPVFAADDLTRLAAFYRDVLGLDVVMDHGWIVTLAPAVESAGAMIPQISFASEGGSGAPVPDLSIEVDDLAAVLERARAAGADIVYGPTDEPWGVSRFFLRDPAGRLINVLVHTAG